LRVVQEARNPEDRGNGRGYRRAAMEPDRFLDLLEQDGARLASVARRGDLDSPIPTCPGWTVADCGAHTADVYQHKVACMRLQRRPEAALLWLWGRRPDSVVELDGDPAALTAFRDRLRIATQ
jgi:Mycothiol maleylpyruvate isomerase N-terminal domain